MLRFSRSLELVLRQKETRFSKEFWKGLGVAVGFHVTLFALFRIATTPNLDAVRPLLPVHVEIDLGQRETVAILAPAQIMHSPIETLDPPSLDKFMALSFIETHTPSYYTKKRTRSSPDFSELERIEYLPLESLP